MKTSITCEALKNHAQFRCIKLVELKKSWVKKIFENRETFKKGNYDKLTNRQSKLYTGCSFLKGISKTTLTS